MTAREPPQGGRRPALGTLGWTPPGFAAAGAPGPMSQPRRLGGAARGLSLQIASDGSVEHFYGCVLQSSRLHWRLLGSAEEPPDPLISLRKPTFGNPKSNFSGRFAAFLNAKMRCAQLKGAEKRPVFFPKKRTSMHPGRRYSPLRFPFS